MSIRKIAFGSLAAVVAGGVSLVLAPGASATATHNVTLTCQAPTTIYGDIGDTFIFTMANTCASNYEFYNSLDYDNGPAGFLQYVSSVNEIGLDLSTVDWYGYSDGLGTTTFTTILLSTNSSLMSLSVGDKVAEVDQDTAASSHDIVYGGSAVADVVGQTPPPVSQAVGMPISGSCLDVNDAALNWGGSTSGNWKASWQEWVNNGAGGSVCQRTLHYVGEGQWVSN